MPFGNRTGPVGAGPMTGRGMGWCADLGMPGRASQSPGQGFQRGFRRGGGMGQAGGLRRRYMRWNNMRDSYMPSTVPSQDEENQFLRNQASSLQAQLDNIKLRLNEMEAEKA